MPPVISATRPAVAIPPARVRSAACAVGPPRQQALDVIRLHGRRLRNTAAGSRRWKASFRGAQPSAFAGTTKSASSPSMRAATTSRSAIARIAHKQLIAVQLVLVRSRAQRSGLTASGDQEATLSNSANVAFASPRQMAPRYWASGGREPALERSPVRPATRAREIGPGSSARPISSSVTAISTMPMPKPPYSSGKMNAGPALLGDLAP